MTIGEDQMPDRFREVVAAEIEIFKRGRSITVRNTLPETSAIPIENRSLWLRIPDVICVFVDMVGSTQLSAAKYDQSTAGAYHL